MYQMRQKQLLNLGDTSFRRHDYATVLPYCLTTLLQLRIDNKEIFWDGNPTIQAEYYKSLLDNSDFFTESSDRSRLSQRGRTNTNILVKLGLCTPDRVVSQVAKNWINAESNTKQPDQIENLVGLKRDNLLYLRQLLKLRFYDKKRTQYVYPFRLVIRILSVVDRMPQDVFSLFFFAITPFLSRESINQLIEIASTYDNHRPAKEEKERIKNKLNACIPGSCPTGDKTRTDINELFNRNNFCSPTLDGCSNTFTGLFKDTFYNRKSRDAVSDYYLFFHFLMLFNRAHDSQTLAQLKQISNRPSIRSAFAAGGRLFQSENQPHSGVQQFLDTNSSSIYLQQPLDFYAIYMQFIYSKNESLRAEYLDMSSRIMLLSGIITNTSGQFSLRYSKLWKELFDYHDIPLNGVGSYRAYEQDENSIFYGEQSVVDILGYSADLCQQFLDGFIRESDVATLEDLQQQFQNIQSDQFKELIRSEFPKNKVIEILRKIDKHNDKDKSAARRADKYVKNNVTDATDIPTIFEYILNIAWFYLSNKTIDPFTSMNLTCDGNMRPLSHASGGAGDIEVRQSDSVIVLLEASLMNGNTQKRGELEPVIRHSTNLTIDNPDRCVQTIFCSNAIDSDVANIYRAASNIELYHSSRKEAAPTDGVNIFAITIQELITFLNDNRLSADVILRKIYEFDQQDRNALNRWEWGNWRELRIRSMHE